MTELRILTVRQPWAWAIIHGGKDVENRVRNIAGGYRGPVAIHAAKGVGSTDEFMANTVAVAKIGRPVPFGLTYGAIIGVVDIVEVHSPATDLTRDDFCQSPMGDLCSAWAQIETWHLVLANPRALAEPIPYRGALGLRRLAEDMAARVMEAVA